LARNLVEVGDMPELAGLFGERGDKMRMGVAKRIDGDAGCEIEVALAISGARCSTSRTARSAR
jgi:hypothetical protein